MAYSRIQAKEQFREYINSIALSLVLKAKRRGFDVNLDDAIDEILDAIETVNERRRFVPTDKQLVESKYEGLIQKMAICSIAKYGAEGQTSHSENGISRGYDSASNYPKALLSEIIPLARGVGDD